MRRVVWLVLMALAFALGSVFAYYNTAPVALDFLAGQSERPLVFWLLLAFVLGVALALLLSLVRSLGLRRDLHNLKRQLSRTEAELKTLRGLPLKES